METKFLNYLKEELNFTVTENGAIAYKSTGRYCLDAFASLAAMRYSPEEQIIDTFKKALLEDKIIAMRILFYVRDIRAGQGMRRVFRIILKWLAVHYPNLVELNLHNILFFGRGDDFLCLLDTPMRERVSRVIYEIIASDFYDARVGREVSLMAKWMPSENASSLETKRYARILMKEWYSPKEYRTVLSFLRQYTSVVERKMSEKDWGSIDYNTVPSKAASKYTNAFLRHDEERYSDYIFGLITGKSKVNAGALFPVDIVGKIMRDYGKLKSKDIVLYDAMWKALPNYLKGHTETGICVVDTSGSMSGTPMEVALSLGLYCADKCRGPFKNHFITFSCAPELQQVHGANIVEKITNMRSSSWGINTNIEKVFDLLLDTAINNNCHPDDMPQKLYIISDMQFDEAYNGYNGYTEYGWTRAKQKKVPFMTTMRFKYEKAGYKLPVIVYWNVRASNCGMFQVTFQEEKCAMVSGYSPSLFKAIIEGTTYEKEVNEKGEIVVKEKIDPMTVMLTTIGNERYDRVFPCV